MLELNIRVSALLPADCSAPVGGIANVLCKALQFEQKMYRPKVLLFDDMEGLGFEPARPFDPLTRKL